VADIWTDTIQGRDSLEDDEHTGWTRMVRTEVMIQEVAMLVHVNFSKMVAEVGALAGISHGTCHIILSDDLNMSHVTMHDVPHALKQDQHDDHTSNCSDLINNSDKVGNF
jgi:hypothetical protein